MEPPSPPDPAAGPELWEALARYSAGESPPEEASAVERWLAQDPKRAELLASLDRSLQALAFRPPEVDVEAAIERVWARTADPDVLPLPARESLTPERAAASKRTTLLRIAASLTVLLGGVLVWQWVQRPATAPAQTFATGVGQTDSVRLPDGSVVRLGPGSRLTVAGAYGEGRRDVQLSGEALFRVAHDEARPFSVRAGAASVTDLGTSFTVRTGEDEVTVVVTEGSVLLAAAGAPAVEGVVLAAGDKGVLGPDRTPVPQRAAATEADLAWTDGRLVFDNAPFSRVAADVRRWYGVDLQLSDPTLADRHLTAVFAGETVDEVLEVIGLALGAEVERRGDQAVLRAAAEPGVVR